MLVKIHPAKWAALILREAAHAYPVVVYAGENLEVLKLVKTYGAF